MNEEAEDDEKVKQFETCPICKKDGRSLNDIIEPMITEMKEKMKSSEMVGNYFPPKYYELLKPVKMTWVLICKK
jgi:tRNA U54 and U55 pseudouridine synthase Pus10